MNIDQYLYMTEDAILADERRMIEATVLYVFGSARMIKELLN